LVLFIANSSTRLAEVRTVNWTTSVVTNKKGNRESHRVSYFLSFTFQCAVDNGKLFFVCLVPHGFLARQANFPLPVDLEHLDEHLIPFFQLIGHFFEPLVGYLGYMK
jgi:hypothetical protein